MTLRQWGVEFERARHKSERFQCIFHALLCACFFSQAFAPVSTSAGCCKAKGRGFVAENWRRASS